MHNARFTQTSEEGVLLAWCDYIQEGMIRLALRMWK